MITPSTAPTIDAVLDFDFPSESGSEEEVTSVGDDELDPDMDPDAAARDPDAARPPDVAKPLGKKAFCEPPLKSSQSSIDAQEIIYEPWLNTRRRLSLRIRRVASSSPSITAPIRLLRRRIGRCWGRRILW